MSPVTRATIKLMQQPTPRTVSREMVRFYLLRHPITILLLCAIVFMIIAVCFSVSRWTQSYFIEKLVNLGFRENASGEIVGWKQIDKMRPAPNWFYYEIYVDIIAKNGGKVRGITYLASKQPEFNGTLLNDGVRNERGDFILNKPLKITAEYCPLFPSFLQTAQTSIAINARNAIGGGVFLIVSIICILTFFWMAHEIKEMLTNGQLVKGIIGFSKYPVNAGKLKKIGLITGVSIFMPYLPLDVAMLDHSISRAYCFIYSSAYYAELANGVLSKEYILLAHKKHKRFLIAIAPTEEVMTFLGDD